MVLAEQVLRVAVKASSDLTKLEACATAVGAFSITLN